MARKLESGLDRLCVVLGAAMVAATLALLVVTDGGQSEGEGAGAQSGGSPAEVNRVAIKDFKFMPPEIVVPAGTKITWTNSDSAAHTATSGPSPRPDGVFDTGTIEGGASGSVTVRKRGTFAYFCELHAFMKGTVTVE